MSTRRRRMTVKSVLGPLCTVSLLLLTICRPAQSEDACGAQSMGIAMVPRMAGGDEVEQAFYSIAGQVPRVDRIYTVEDGKDLFVKLEAVRKLGKQIDFLVIMGHGSKANPSIDFAQGPLLPSDIDLPGLKSTRDKYQKMADQYRGSGRDTKMVVEKVKDLNDQIQFLQQAFEVVPEVMARDAEVVLINCSAAATPEGKQFVRNLANLLLSKRGGTVTAATRDVNITQASNIISKLAGLYATGQWMSSGDYFVASDWERFPVNAAGAPGTTPGSNSGRFLLQPADFEVLDANTKDFITGRQNSTPTSRWRVDEKALTFHSDLDGYQVDASWTQPPPRLAQGDCFRLDVNVTVSGPRRLQAAVTPVMSIAEWQIEPWSPSPAATHPGPNAYVLTLPAGAANRKAMATMSLKVTLAGPPRSINLATDARSGGNLPIQTNELFLQLNVNNYAKINWTYLRLGKKRTQ